jgi:hypothetical protein
VGFEYHRRTLARNPEALFIGPITRNAAGAPTSAAVRWPDGNPGVFTATVLSTSFPGAIDGYQITYGDGDVRVYIQPTITRDSAGRPTVIPPIVEV